MSDSELKTPKALAAEIVHKYWAGAKGDIGQQMLEDIAQAIEAERAEYHRHGYEKGYAQCLHDAKPEPGIVSQELHPGPCVVNTSIPPTWSMHGKCLLCAEALRNAEPGIVSHYNSNKTEAELSANNVEQVLEYCRPHLSQMWASTVVGLLLNCDFRDAATELAKVPAPDAKAASHLTAEEWDKMHPISLTGVEIEITDAEIEAAAKAWGSKDDDDPLGESTLTRPELGFVAGFRAALERTVSNDTKKVSVSPDTNFEAELAKRMPRPDSDEFREAAMETAAGFETSHERFCVRFGFSQGYRWLWEKLEGKSDG